MEAVSGADAAVVVTEWNDLKALPRPEVRRAMNRPLIVDGRNLLDPETVRRAGFVYEGIGRSGPEPVELVEALAPSDLPSRRADDIRGQRRRQPDWVGRATLAA